MDKLKEKNSGNKKITTLCSGCKKVQDEFFGDENPEDFGWIYYKKKWYCNKYCSPKGYRPNNY
jgi:hypothetical protein